MLFLYDSYKGARWLKVLVSNPMLFFKLKYYFHYSSFPIVFASFSYKRMCVQRNKVWCIFLPLQLCWMYMLSVPKCDAFCLSAFVVAWFSTWLLLAIVESCYRLIGDEMCVQKLNDKKLRIQKFAYDNNFILTYSEHNCVHSFYSFVYFYDAV